MITKRTDYIYCKDCRMYVDLWKYGDVKNTGHDDCRWRYVTKAELKQCIKDCEKEGCFEESSLCW